MTPIEMLTHEHRVIEKALDALAVFAGNLRDGKPASREDLGLFVEFIRKFADACHHGKEEDILFAALAERGMPKDGGPLGVMLLEHGQGRNLARVLGEVADGNGPLTAPERARAATAAQAYGELLRNHIGKEDRILYPMALRLLPDDAWARIATAFEEFEATKTGAGEHERLHELAHALIAKYRVA